MTSVAWLLLCAILLLDTGSHLLLKSASVRAAGAQRRPFVVALLREPLMWLAAVMFVVLFFSWLGFLSLVPLSQGVMAGSITIAGVMVGGRLFFNEAITPARAASAGLIGAGVLLVGLGG